MSTMTPQQNASAALSGEGNHGLALTKGKIAKFRDQFGDRPTNKLMQNAVTQNSVQDVALDRDIIHQTDHTFSHRLDDWSVTNQKKSGRCWMFAGLNLLRVGAMKKMNLKEFEFSQNYTQFWDKFERANYFLESIIATADRDIDDRTVAWILDHPLDDGGQWNMFVNIVKKHGLVPKSKMPETESSSNTAVMNSLLLYKLREGALKLRQQADSNPESLREIKDEILGTIHRILCIHLGTPPSKFDWQWYDTDKKFHRKGEMSPQEFAQEYVELDLDNYVCVVNDPRSSSPYGQTFTVEFLGNTVGGEMVKYLNVPSDVMKKIAMQTIEDGEPVWMGCDVGKMMRRDMGIWDARLFQYDGVYDTEFSLDKSQRLIYHQTVMTHAMLFTGVDVIDEGEEKSPRRWRVENSWGDENGRKGFYVMNDNWFEEHMFEIAAHKKYLPQDLLAELNEEPIVLPAWDPMGSLAGR